MNIKEIKEKIKNEKITSFLSDNYPELTKLKPAKYFPLYSFFICKSDPQIYFLYFGNNNIFHKFLYMKDINYDFINDARLNIFNGTTIQLATINIEFNEINKIKNSSEYYIKPYTFTYTKDFLHDNEKYTAITNLLQLIDWEYPELLLKLYQ